MNLSLLNNELNPNAWWSNIIYDTPKVDDVALFDTNGYDLCGLEQQYAITNLPATKHRYKLALRYDWFEDLDHSFQNAHINHALLFERKGYDSDAKAQLLEFSRTLPLCHKLLKIHPKWGIDFAVDYCDQEGNVFEVFHYEWDSFHYEEVCNAKARIEELVLNTDWDDAAKKLLIRKSEWDSLSFFEQSDWKCKYFGVEPEQFKIVIWNK